LPTVNELTGNTGTTQSIAPRVPEAEPWNGHLDVSNLGAGRFEGGAGVQESQSYYYGAPTQPAAYDGQTSDFDINQFTPVDLPAGSLVQWAPGVDRNVDSRLINIVLEIAQRFGRPLTLTSGYRSPARNRNAGGARRSQHMLGKAVDVSGSGLNNQDRLNLVGIASSLGIIGIGVYSGGSLHFDIRDGARAGWGSDYTYNSVPSYAVAAINRHLAGGYPPPDPLANPAPTVDPNATGLDPASQGVSPGYPADMSQAEIEGIIRQEAIARNMDPDTAVRIFRAEGAGGYQSSVPRSGTGSYLGLEDSHGPYQLYRGGGLGNEYERLTGRNLRTDNTREGITNQIRFALDQAAGGGGWQPWYGRGPAGVGQYEGLRGATPINNWN
jgi:hypothetical protein